MPYRVSLTILMGASLVAIASGLYAYFAPLTGVTGVWGPLAATFGAVCLLIGGALLARARRRGSRAGLLVLLALGIVLTAFAAWLLHQWVMLAALAICAIGWIGALSGPKLSGPKGDPA
ncbi:hypothetical protein AL036_05650 [Salipiger aestuarii]|uniref:Uncharacterized protein n=1 Tax=Salipiger aestuarii TaxID=568098 RepID=A0A327YIU7_9RHOB|nr:hypothetical protein [Salipiger aestuarii]EIE50828.1 hypothetical protein C357_11814 [Citreicella sp. 357]KAA8608893.1 hypothetical protein AL036_05650 [Salipiger aestuarii]KAB2543050.1 hypothetical protein AL035_04140 [Salipiger aestuarii]RAK19685.1 hypothetical protein ATI53_100867 [Salipiger aestuarii]